MIVDAGTNLTRLTGKRVRIDRPAYPGADRSVHYGVFETLWHSEQMPDSVGGMLIEEPHGSCPGGTTGFHVPYGSTVTVVPTSTPPLEGVEHADHDGRYRLWTAGHGLAFDEMPPHADGGPYLATVDGWLVTTTTTTGEPGQTLSVWRGDWRSPERHPLDGTHYDTSRESDRAAYEAGVTGFMVYEKHASRYDALHA